MSSGDKSALPSLPGYDADNLQSWTVAVVVSMTLLALFVVGLRVVSRRLNHQPLWWDDKMILFSMVRFFFSTSRYLLLPGISPWIDDVLVSQGVESCCCGFHLCHVLFRTGCSCRHGRSCANHNYVQMVGRRRGSLCLEPGLDQTQSLADVLSHLST